MGKRGPQAAPPSEVFFFAQMFYRELRLLETGYPRWRVDPQRLQAVAAEIEREIQLTDEDHLRIARDVDRDFADEQVTAGERARRAEMYEQAELASRREGA